MRPFDVEKNKFLHDKQTLRDFKTCYSDIIYNRLGNRKGKKEDSSSEEEEETEEDNKKQE